ncbi:hypothetical protein BDV96DRAFT_26715 [Lophiotrema nucula]|uniref:Uncharacterized protein n=1 Tax=Lophiotrema nucula TaxID=690887 RepID=A0A6A5ZGG1_9PLEO|nr:hypothetical protein BDV96DRAFT_26715 [Lophiotrema nucula]
MAPAVKRMHRVANGVRVEIREPVTETPELKRVRSSFDHTRTTISRPEVSIIGTFPWNLPTFLPAPRRIETNFTKAALINKLYAAAAKAQQHGYQNDIPPSIESLQVELPDGSTLFPPAMDRCEREWDGSVSLIPDNLKLGYRTAHLSKKKMKVQVTNTVIANGNSCKPASLAASDVKRHIKDIRDQLWSASAGVLQTTAPAPIAAAMPPPTAPSIAAAGGLQTPQYFPTVAVTPPRTASAPSIAQPQEHFEDSGLGGMELDEVLKDSSMQDAKMDEVAAERPVMSFGSASASNNFNVPSFDDEMKDFSLSDQVNVEMTSADSGLGVRSTSATNKGTHAPMDSEVKDSSLPNQIEELEVSKDVAPATGSTSAPNNSTTAPTEDAPKGSSHDNQVLDDEYLASDDDTTPEAIISQLSKTLRCIPEAAIRRTLHTGPGIQSYWTEDGTHYVQPIPIRNLLGQCTSQILNFYPVLNVFDAYPSTFFYSDDGIVFYMIYHSSNGDFFSIADGYSQLAEITDYTPLPPPKPVLPSSSSSSTLPDFPTATATTTTTKHEDAPTTANADARKNIIASLASAWKSSTAQINSLLSIDNTTNNYTLISNLSSTFDPLADSLKTLHPRLSLTEVHQTGLTLEKLVFLFHNIASYIALDDEKAEDRGIILAADTFEMLGRCVPGGQVDDLWDRFEPPQFVRDARTEHEKKKMADKEMDSALDDLGDLGWGEQSKEGKEGKTVKDAWARIKSEMAIFGADPGLLKNSSVLKTLMAKHITPATEVFKAIADGASTISTKYIKAAGWDAYPLYSFELTVLDRFEEEHKFYFPEGGAWDAYRGTFQEFQKGWYALRDALNAVLP